MKISFEEFTVAKNENQQFKSNVNFCCNSCCFYPHWAIKSQENLLHYNSTTEALTEKNDSDEFPLPVGRLMFSMMPVTYSVTRFISLETFHVSFARVSSLVRKIYS